MKKHGRTILRISALTLGLVSVAALLGFVESASERMPVKDITIEMRGGADALFIGETEIREKVLEGRGVVGVALGAMDLRAIEDDLREIPCVAEANVFYTMDASLHVVVEQRVPILRVFDRLGHSYYIDTNGKTMPISAAHTARVLVALDAAPLPMGGNAVRNVIGGDSLMRADRMDRLYALAVFITKDPLWNSLIDQIVITRTKEFELVPRIGMQRIRIGDGTHLEERFAKLRLYYADKAATMDGRRYSTLDLRFADQVVCTQRTQP